jgi:MATE family multidrug resistance protein
MRKKPKPQNRKLKISPASATAARKLRQYFDIRIWSAPASLCQYVILGWFLGRQNTTNPLLIVVTN